MNSYSLMIVPLIGLGGYYGYNYLYNYIVSKAMEEVNKKFSNTEEQLQIVNNTAIISYQYGGKNYKVCVPYDSSKVRGALRKEVFLIRGNERIDITHKPGIPYLLSAKDMGGNRIIVTKDEQILNEFEENEIPII